MPFRSTPPEDGRDSLPRPAGTLRAATVLTAVEGAALTALAVGYGVRSVVDRPEDRTGAALGAALTLLAGLTLIALARGLLGAGGWSRSPTLVLQLLAVPVGLGLLTGRTALIGLAVLVLAVAVLGLLATPSARAAFHD